MSWMTPWFILQFLTAPVSMALHITARQRTAMLLQIAGLLLRTSMVYATGLLIPSLVSEAYALSGALFYLTYLALTLNAASIPTRQAIHILKAGLPIHAAWVLGAITVRAVAAWVL